MSVKLDDNSISTICDVNYGCIINRISKSKAANLMQNADLSQKSGPL